MPVSRNSRKYERTLSDELVKLKWTGASGEPHFASGKVLDCYESGLRIEIAEPIQIRSYVALRRQNGAIIHNFLRFLRELRKLLIPAFLFVEPVPCLVLTQLDAVLKC